MIEVMPVEVTIVNHPVAAESLTHLRDENTSNQFFRAELRRLSLVVVAEGAKPKPGTLKLPVRSDDIYGREKLGDIAHVIAPEISARTGFESRVVQLGHIQRGGTPTSYDRVLSTRFGLAAVDAVHDKAFGEMVVLKCGAIARVDMAITAGQTRTIDLALFADVAATFFG